MVMVFFIHLLSVIVSSVLEEDESPDDISTWSPNDTAPFITVAVQRKRKAKKAY